MEPITCLIDGKHISVDDVVAASMGFGRVVAGLPSWKYEVRIPTEIFVRSVGPLFKRFVDLELADDEEIDDQDLLALLRVGCADLSQSLLVEADLTRRVMKRFMGMEIVNAFTSADQELLPRKVFVLQTLDEINLVGDAVLLLGLAYPAR